MNFIVFLQPRITDIPFYAPLCFHVHVIVIICKIYFNCFLFSLNMIIMSVIIHTINALNLEVSDSLVSLCMYKFFDMLFCYLFFCLLISALFYNIFASLLEGTILWRDTTIARLQKNITFTSGERYEI